MLFKRHHWEGLADGSITLAFRRWKRPTVKAGGTLQSPVGVLAIGAVDVVAEKVITAKDARRAGFASREALLKELRARAEGTLYRIELRLAGRDPRAALRARDTWSDEEVEAVTRKLARYDSASRSGPWTRKTLRLIAKYPESRAADLAPKAGLEKDAFKTNVRKLKNLGLTESLAKGYRLSPRGRSFLDLA